MFQLLKPGINLRSGNHKQHQNTIIQSFSKGASKYIQPKRLTRSIGIDLGTTNSCVAYMDGETPRVIENAEGQRTTPSVIAWSPMGEIMIGTKARRQAASNTQNTIYATKRLIGRKYSDEAIQNFIPNVGFKIVEAENGDAWVEVNNTTISPSQAGSYILEELKKSAEKFLNDKISKAVITVPAYFNDSQRQATKDAGTLAGLKVDRIINEPTAAALAYGLKDRKDCKIAVYDLGGGTFDITILAIEDGVFEVKATNGDTLLGGEDFDLRIINFIVEETKRKYDVNLRQYDESMQRIRFIAEMVKIELSSVEEYLIEIPYILPSPPYHISLKITRQQFVSMIDDLLQRIRVPCEKCIRDSSVSLSEISEVLLVGGMTKMPKVSDLAGEIFRKPPNISLNPDESVALGAAIQAAILQGQFEDFLLLDVAPLSLGIETKGGLFERIIPRNTKIPIEIKQTFTTGVDWQSEVLISVYQGERDLVEDNKFLGQLKLPVSRQLKGEPQIEVIFKIDENGIVHIVGQDLNSPSSKKEMLIEAVGSLKKDEIDRILKDSKAHAAEDIKKKDKVKAIGIAEFTISDFKSMLRLHASKLAASDVEDVHKQIDLVVNEVARPGSSADSIRHAVKLLQDSFLLAFQNAKSKNDTPQSPTPS